MSKHIVDQTKNGVRYDTIQQMSEDNTPTSTQINNHVAQQGISRRKKIVIVDDDQQNRRLRAKQRLQKKLAAKKKKSN